jgi:hypothetical protein
MNSKAAIEESFNHLQAVAIEQGTAVVNEGGFGMLPVFVQAANPQPLKECNPAAGILTGMALNNVEQAARLLKINAPGMAIWHLREALAQLETDEKLSQSQEQSQPTIELNASNEPSQNGN